MTRVVLDTNIFISAFLFGGKPSEILKHIEAGRIALAYSPAIQRELEGVLATKFRWPANMIDLGMRPALEDRPLRNAATQHTSLF